jgi:uncharacterized protein YcfL
MKRMTAWFTALAALAGVAVLTGCTETAGTVVTTDHTTGVNTLVESNSSLKDEVKVAGVAYDTVNGMKRVTYKLASSRHRRLRLDYRISWFDANGMEIDPDTKTYRNLILEGRDEATVTGVANSPAAVTSRLRVRETEDAD